MPTLLPQRSAFLWATLFAVAMGFLEGAVVIYIRKLYFPEGFSFPLVPMHPDIMVTELVREVATIVMLLSVGAMLARSALERFAFFIFCFGIWDLFYYVSLKAVLDWPQSLFTQDVLFLIPIPWTGPVYAPMIVSLGLIGLGTLLVKAKGQDPSFRVTTKEWGILILGSLVIIFAFVLDHALYILEDHSFWALFPFSQDRLFELSEDFIPRAFPVRVYLAGLLIDLLGMVSILRRSGLLEKKVKEE